MFKHKSYFLTSHFHYEDNCDGKAENFLTPAVFNRRKDKRKKMTNIFCTVDFIHHKRQAIQFSFFPLEGDPGRKKQLF